MRFEILMMSHFEYPRVWWRGVSRSRKTWRLVKLLNVSWPITQTWATCVCILFLILFYSVHLINFTQLVDPLIAIFLFFDFSIWSDGARLTSFDSWNILRFVVDIRRCFRRVWRPIFFIIFFCIVGRSSSSIASFETSLEVENSETQQEEGKVTLQ